MNLRIGLAQINTTVGDLKGNADKVLEFAAKAEDAEVDIVIFPELAVSGYPPEDLLLRQRFLADCLVEIDRIAAGSGEAALVVGFPHGTPEGLFNAAAIVQRGSILGFYHKNLLPNYGVFDEKRYFKPGDSGLVLDFGRGRAAVHICEDTWIAGSRPIECVESTGANLILNLSASPFHRKKMELRRKVLADVNASCGTHTFYVNLVGGQDELVFDGGSMVVSDGGAVLAMADRFREDLLLHDVEIQGAKALPGCENGWEIIQVRTREAGERMPIRPRRLPAMVPEEEVYEALVLGTRDYLHKNGFSHALLGISGGIDSALVAAIARDALGPDNVTGVTMPGPYTSDETRLDADVLADNLGIELYEFPIGPLTDAYAEALKKPFDGTDRGVAEENIQARIRGNLLMALSNKFGWMVLNTGNKSETAVGYCTLYGDMAGGLSVLMDVPKTLVYELSSWRNRQPDGPVIPESTMERPPTAELREGQKDSDSLPEYDRLDPILEAYVEQDAGPGEIIRDKADAETVRRVLNMVDAAEYKRRQAPPGLKITPKAFGRDRRLPITNRYKR